MRPISRATTPIEPARPARTPAAEKTLSLKETSRSQGFTLVEMVVTMLVLVIIAGLIMPNVVAFERSRAAKALEGSIEVLPARAKELALQKQEPVAIVIQGNQIVLEEMPPQGFETINSTQTLDTGSPIVLQQVDLSDAMTVSRVDTGGQPADMGTWQWTAYPDGSADDGGIQFQEGPLTRSLVLLPNSQSEWIEGPLPDQTPTSWQAGQLQQKAQTSQ